MIEPKITYKYHVHSTQQQAEAQEEEEEKPVLTEEEKKQQEQEDALITEQIKKKDTGKNYFGVNLGMMSGSLSLDLSEYGGGTEEKMSGANVAFSLAYMRKMTNRLWFGGSIGYAMLPSGEFEFPLCIRNDRCSRPANGRPFAGHGAPRGTGRRAGYGPGPMSSGISGPADRRRIPARDSFRTSHAKGLILGQALS